MNDHQEFSLSLAASIKRADLIMEDARKLLEEIRAERAQKQSAAFETNEPQPSTEPPPHGITG